MSDENIKSEPQQYQQSQRVQDFFKHYGIPVLAENLDIDEYTPEALAALSIHELQDNFNLSKETAKNVYNQFEQFRKPEMKKQQKGLTLMVQNFQNLLTPTSSAKVRKQSFMSEFEDVTGIDFKPTDDYPMDPCSAANGASTAFFKKDFALHSAQYNDFTNSRGWTPLMYACALRREEIVKTVLSGNPDLCIQNGVKQTALIIAACFGHVSIIDLLIQYSKKRSKEIQQKSFADIVGLHLVDDCGFTALHSAVYYAQDDAVKYLLSVGANPNTPDKDGMTPTLLACADRHRRKCLEALKKRNGDLSIRNQKGQNGFDLQKLLLNDDEEEVKPHKYGYF